MQALEHLEDNNNILYYVNGEPSVWTCWQAGVPAVSSIFGEGKIPTSILQEFQEVGIEPEDVEIHIVFDNDQTGQKASIEAYNTLKRLGFKVKVKQLPSFLPEKADVQDLYIYLKGDNSKFQTTLQNLIEVDVSKAKKQENTVLDIIESLQIDKLEQLRIDGEIFYRLYFKNGEWIELEDKDLASKRRFSIKIMNQIGVLVDFGKEFKELINTLLSNQEVKIIGYSIIEEIQDEIQIILSRMSTTNEILEINQYPQKYIDKENGKVYVKRSFLEASLSKNYKRRDITEAIDKLGGRQEFPVVKLNDKRKTIRAISFPIDVLLIEDEEEESTQETPQQETHEEKDFENLDAQIENLEKDIFGDSENAEEKDTFKPTEYGDDDDYVPI